MNVQEILAMIMQSMHFTLLECPSPIRATPTLETAKVTRAVERVIVAQAMWLGNVFCQVQRRVTPPRGEAVSLDHDLKFVLKNDRKSRFNGNCIEKLPVYSAACTQKVM